jgi:polyisoprenoid-binding protein YceI
MKTTCLVLFLLGTTLAAAGPWRVAESSVRVSCPMTIGGSFEAKTAALTGSVTASASQSTALDGSFAVDLRTLDTGIGLRNEHLQKTYLEVDKGTGYDQAVLSDIDLKGLNPETPQGKGSFTGLLTLHGVKKMVSGTVNVVQSAAGFRVNAAFPINLSDYGVSEPRSMGIGVKDTVQVQVTITVTH